MQRQYPRQSAFGALPWQKIVEEAAGSQGAWLGIAKVQSTRTRRREEGGGGGKVERWRKEGRGGGGGGDGTTILTSINNKKIDPYRSYQLYSTVWLLRELVGQDFYESPRSDEKVKCTSCLQFCPQATNLPHFPTLYTLYVVYHSGIAAALNVDQSKFYKDF
ncbi:hypothetical protein HZH68_007162 [Vespula germanica]|uniref:Uncharacterized protein n=1 Tax=Vespula germanica TaxID=30212 RepID=A0A834N9N6_VESGE|nr:hypothetical protein HZH68_007162 [Vespula germanica]